MSSEAEESVLFGCRESERAPTGKVSAYRDEEWMEQRAGTKGYNRYLQRYG